MDEFADDQPVQPDEPRRGRPAKEYPTDWEHQPVPAPELPLRDPTRHRFHASGYQFNLQTTLWLFTAFSVLFLPMSAVAPQDRFIVGALLAISVGLAIYAFVLITWIPDSALVIFLVSAPVALVALALALARFIRL